jgi:hypothetical protein
MRFLPPRLTRQKAQTGGKRLFWLWIAYQTIKGTLTTALIWIPLLYYYWQNL